jgi:hypothetical protein
VRYSIKFFLFLSILTTQITYAERCSPAGWFFFADSVSFGTHALVADPLKATTISLAIISTFYMWDHAFHKRTHEDNHGQSLCAIAAGLIQGGYCGSTCGPAIRRWLPNQPAIVGLEVIQGDPLGATGSAWHMPTVSAPIVAIGGSVLGASLTALWCYRQAIKNRIAALWEKVKAEPFAACTSVMLALGILGFGIHYAAQNQLIGTHTQ